MRIRPAEARDLSRITEITVSSLRDDPTFDYQWQNRHLFPDDNVFFWHIQLKKMLYDPRMRFHVVELEEGDAEPAGLGDVSGTSSGESPRDPFSDQQHSQRDEDSAAGVSPLAECEKEKLHGATTGGMDGAAAAATTGVITARLGYPRTVIAYGIWERVGDSRAARSAISEKNTWVNKLDRFAAALERWLLSRKNLVRRDGSEAREAALHAASASVRRECFLDARIREWWSMELLVTDRPYRRRGAAAKLVELGLVWADTEGLWAGVEASPMGELVYGRLGFVRRASRTVRVEGEDEELTFCVMVRPPRSKADEAAS